MRNFDLIHELIKELGSYGAKAVRPFPYSDCRKLIDSLTLQERNHFQDFTADLNTFDMAVSGPISWDTKILDWPQERVERVYKYVEKNFFQRFPRYKIVKRLINRTDTPNLFEDIRTHNKIRKILLKLLPLLMTKQPS